MGDGLSVKVSRPFCMRLASDGLFFLPCRRIYCHVRRSYWSGTEQRPHPRFGQGPAGLGTCVERERGAR